MNKLQALKLKYVTGYNEPQRYWNERWSYGEEKTNFPQFESRIREILHKTRSQNILDVGCGPATLRGLPNYVGLDFSTIILQQSGLTEYIYADFSKHIPLPDKCFDASLCANALLHVPPSRIDRAIDEICRVTRNAVILVETYKFKPNQPHCFAHNLPLLFKEKFDGEVFILTEEKK